jgi:chaperone modulatory protein CbpM
MAAERDIALWLDAREQVSLVELAECAGLTVADLRELVEYGALAPADPQADEWVFSASSVVTLRAAARVCRDLELETAAIALVLSYLDRIRSLEEEVRDLHAQLGGLRR